MKASLNPEVVPTSEASMLLESPAPLRCVPILQVYIQAPGGVSSWAGSGGGCLGLKSQPACQPGSAAQQLCGLEPALLAFCEGPFISASVKWGGWCLCLYLHLPLPLPPQPVAHGILSNFIQTVPLLCSKPFMAPSQSKSKSPHYGPQSPA